MDVSIGVVGLQLACKRKSNGVGKPTVAGDSPVDVSRACEEYPEYHGAR
jgi:hypothetical protein